MYENSLERKEILTQLIHELAKIYFIFIDRIESSFNFISKPFASFQWPYFGFKAYLTLFGIGVCDALHYIFLTFQKEQVYTTVTLVFLLRKQVIISEQGGFFMNFFKWAGCIKQAG